VHTVIAVVLIVFQIVVKNVEIAVQTEVAVVEIVCHVVTKNVDIDCQTLTAVSVITFQALVKNSIKDCQMARPVSVLVKNNTTAATTATLAVITATIGFASNTALNAPKAAVAPRTTLTNVLSTVNILPIP